MHNKVWCHSMKTSYILKRAFILTKHQNGVNFAVIYWIHQMYECTSTRMKNGWHLFLTRSLIFQSDLKSVCGIFQHWFYEPVTIVFTKDVIKGWGWQKLYLTTINSQRLCEQRQRKQYMQLIISHVMGTFLKGTAVKKKKKKKKKNTRKYIQRLFTSENGWHWQRKK